MDLAKTIEINQAALARIVAGLFAMIGLAAGETIERLPVAMHRAVLRVLRPAESAVRRLIIIAAHGLVVAPKPAKEKAARAAAPSGPTAPRQPGARTPPFQLFDPRKRFDFARRPRSKGPKRAPNPGPRAWVGGSDSSPVRSIFGSDDGDWLVPVYMRPAPPPPPPPAPVLPPPGTIAARRVCRRLAAITNALADIPKQAVRMARWQAKREAKPDAKFRDPLRIGRPPGDRKAPTHEVDQVLKECHHVACNLPKPDTS